MTTSPYSNIDEANWLEVTNELVDKFPLRSEQLVGLVHQAWDDIYTSSFGSTDLKIGESIFLPAQATGVIMEKLIAVRLEQLDPLWRGGVAKTEKDIVRTDNDDFSFEIKTSSSKSGLYGNRSTGHRSANRTKSRAGYYLIVNYKLPKEDDLEKFIQKIRFGWIDDEDWVGLDKLSQQGSRHQSERS